jgi:hypothetical protein
MHSSLLRPSPEADGSATLVVLVRRLTDDVTMLFRQEVALARAEVTRAFSGLLRAAASVVIAGALLYAGLVTLVAAAVLALALVLPAWAAALIVGFVLSSAAALVLRAGVRTWNATAVTPKHSAASLQRDKAVLTRDAHESKR